MEEMPTSISDALRLAVLKLPNPVRLRAENAFAGFDKARMLLPIDREIASFRAITAEEEAAAALFRSLQLQGYPGSERLNVRDHRQKAAVGPFIQAVKASIAQRGNRNLQLTVDWGAPALIVKIGLSEMGVVFEGSEDLALQLVEPLGILSRKGQGHPADFFDEGIKLVATSANYSAMDRMISKEANDRNKVLYASDTALPKSQATEQSIRIRELRAEIVIALCVAVLQTKNHQSLAKQSLQSFLRTVGRQSDDDFSYDPVPVGVDIKMVDGGPSVVKFRQVEVFETVEPIRSES